MLRSLNDVDQVVRRVVFISRRLVWIVVSAQTSVLVRLVHPNETPDGISLLPALLAGLIGDGCVYAAERVGGERRSRVARIAGGHVDSCQASEVVEGFGGPKSGRIYANGPIACGEVRMTRAILTIRSYSKSIFEPPVACVQLSNVCVTAPRPSKKRWLSIVRVASSLTEVVAEKCNRPAASAVRFSL